MSFKFYVRRPLIIALCIAVAVGCLASIGASASDDSMFNKAGNEQEVVASSNNNPTIVDNSVETAPKALGLDEYEALISGSENAGHWSLMNLIMVIAGMAVAITIMVSLALKKSGIGVIDISTIGVIISSVGGAILFGVTQDMGGKMLLTDEWSMWGFAAFALCLLFAVLKVKSFSKI